MNDFLPQDYQVPSSGGRYVKLQPGENKFRVLSSPIVGNEYWNHEGKPVRLKTGDSIDPEDVRPEKDGSAGKVKHFWAMPVFDYRDNQVKILEVTQKGIQSSILELAHDADWGSPVNYDLVITRTGEGFDTEYSVKPKPAKAADKVVTSMWSDVQKNGFNLAALYDGGDPFSATKNARAQSVEEINIDDIQI